MSGEVEALAAAIRAVLDADEEAARAATPGPWEFRWVGQEFQLHGPGQEYPYSVAEWTYVVATWEPEATQERAECETGDAEHMRRHDPAAVLARVAGLRALLDDLLAEPHAVFAPGDPREVVFCPAADWHTGQRDNDEPCRCGRDERLARRLRLLAAAWGQEDAT